MSIPTLSAPFVLRWSNAPAGTNLCAQASYAGANATVTLAQIDFRGGTPLQLWQLGSDGRIYLYGSESQGSPVCIGYHPTSSALNGTNLFLMAEDASDNTQVWDLSTQAPALLNTGAGDAAAQYAMDSGGFPTPGNSITIFTWGPGNPNQEWALQTLPSLLLSQVPA